MLYRTYYSEYYIVNKYFSYERLNDSKVFIKDGIIVI